MLKFDPPTSITFLDCMSTQDDGECEFRKKDAWKAFPFPSFEKCSLVRGGATVYTEFCLSIACVIRF